MSVVISVLEEPLVTQEDATEEPLVEQKDATSMRRQVCPCCKICCLFFVEVYILLSALQGLIDYFNPHLATFSASALAMYAYPGGATSDGGGPAFNLVPRTYLLVEGPGQPGYFGGILGSEIRYDVIPSDETGTIKGAPVGAWYRTWGPIYHTYTYEDANSITTACMRRNSLPLSHETYRVERCDGQGPDVTFEFFQNYFQREIAKLMNFRRYIFKIFHDGEYVITAKGLISPNPAMYFENMTTLKRHGSAGLKNGSFYGKYDEWLVTGQESLPLPYYVTSAATLLFAEYVGHVEV